MYYLKKQGKVTGPFTTVKIKEMLARGFVMKGDYLSADKISWNPIEDVLPNLFPKTVNIAASAIGDIELEEDNKSEGIPPPPEKLIPRIRKPVKISRPDESDMGGSGKQEVTTQQRPDSVSGQPGISNSAKRSSGGVVFIIVIVAILFYSQSGKMTSREDARRISCTSNMKQIGLAIRMYSQECRERFPDKSGAEGLEMLRAGGYLENVKFYTCPSTTDSISDNYDLADPDVTVSYVYVGGYTESESVDTVLLWDKEGNHDNYVNFLYVDGHVEGLTGEEAINKRKSLEQHLQSQPIVNIPKQEVSQPLKQTTAEPPPKQSEVQPSKLAKANK